jgi:hypothetical protein
MILMNFLLAGIRRNRLSESSSEGDRFGSISNSGEEEMDRMKSSHKRAKTGIFKKVKERTFIAKDDSSSFSLNNIGKFLNKKMRTIRNVRKDKDQEDVRHPVYFKYFRINEIGVSLTYKHSDSSMLNTKNLRIIIKPFIKQGKFVSFQKMLSKYENFCKKSLIYQIPSILKQKLLKITLSKDDDRDDDQEGDIKHKRARKILFGDYADR